MSKISEMEFLVLLLAALMFDAITWIPFLGTMINFFATGFFWFYFWRKGIRLSTVKSLLPGIIEFIPVINMLPLWTAAVVIAYMSERAEEKLGLEKLSKAVKS